MRTLTSRDYYVVSGIIFAIVACMHLMRIINHSVFIIGSWHLPIWMSWLGAGVAGYLSYCAYELVEGKKK